MVDQIRVAPVVRSDAQLKNDVSTELKADVATRPFTIGIASNGGTVTLSGTADSWQQKNMFADLAKTVKGSRHSKIGG